MSIKIQLRRDSSSNWVTHNPVLGDGEIGLDETNNYFKIGDGSSAWTALSNFTQSVESVQDIIGAMITGNTESGIAVTYNDATGKLNFDVGDPNLSISGDASGTASMSDLGNTDIAVTLAATGVTAASYGSASQVPVITVDAKGRITAASTTNVAGVTDFDYNTSTGVLDIDTADGANFATTVTLDPFDTADLTEGSNLYFTDARVMTSLATVSGHIIPDTDVTYDLGSSANKFRDLYLSGSTIYLGGATITASGGTVVLPTGSGGESPAFTGTPTAPTAAANTNTTQVATTAYVQAELTELIGGAPGTLDTLNELAAAINDDAAYASTLTTALGTKEPTITAGTTLQYWRGDKSWQTIDSSVVPENTNLYWTTGRGQSMFDTRLATKDTANLAEGTNLYWTTTRGQSMFDTRLATKNTGNLTEGSNLYWTTARGDANFDTRLATKDTGNIGEGSNLYYTDERVDDRVNALLVAGANVSLVYDDSAGTMTIAATEDNLSNNDTDDLSEGSTNLYHTTSRARAAISGTGSLSYSSASGVMSFTQGNTDTITEGSTNLYYTDARSRAAISATGSLAYDNGTGVISFTMNDETVQDIVGAMVASNTESGIAVTYDDASGKLNFDVGDPTITLAGDLTGSVTLTNLANGTLTATIVDDSHNHVIANVDGLQGELDAKVDDSQVLTDVPAGALFTDTVYTHPAAHAISFITGLQAALNGKVDDSQVLTDVPAGALFTDTTYTVGDGGLTTNDFTTADHSKLDGIEASATADQTNGEIRTAVEAATDSNVFTDADHTKLNGIAASATNYSHPANHAISVITGLQAALNLKAPLASPALTGSPTAPTAAANTNTTQVATTAYVQAELTELIGGAPGTLDTLNALAEAINDDAAYASTLTTALGTKVTKTTNQALSSAADAMTISGHTITLNRGDGTTDTVTVPDNNTTYSVGDGALTQKNFTTTLKNKLDAIEASADVTDTTNVVAALTAGSNITIAANGTISSSYVNTTYSVGDGGLTQKNFTTALNTKLTGIETGATADQSASQILTKLKTVDINGSGGLNAGTIDGFTVAKSVPSNALFTDNNTTYSVGNGGLTQVNFTSTLNTKLAGIETAATADQTATEILTKIKTVDGSGSGLDADTVDGVHASQFVRYFESTSAPSTTSNGTMWYDTSDDTLYQRQDSAWVQISTSAAPAVLIYDVNGTLVN